MDFSGSIGDTILDVPLENITKVWKEGLLMKKVCFIAKTNDGEVVWIEFIEDGVTKIINKEDFRDFCKFISQTHDEFIRAEDEED